MISPDAETTIQRIASLLTIRKSTNNRTVLFLGSRAGGLFRNPALYEYIRNFTTPTFERLSDGEKFYECYRILSGPSFNESTRHDILTASLKDCTSREEDEYVAELVKAGFFDIVLTTNIDTLLEDAYFQKMRRSYDYRVFTVGLHAPDGDIVSHETKRGTIVKIFGDLGSRYTTVGNEFNLDKDRRLKEFLESTLARNVLVVGYDPIWDRPVERAFPTPARGSDIVYVNEEPPAQNSHIAMVLEKRRGNHLTGSQGSYRDFMKALYRSLIRGSSAVSQVPPPPLSSRPEPAQQPALPPSVQPEPAQHSTTSSNGAKQAMRNKIFISYSHQDADYLKELQTSMAWYTRQGLIDPWDDTKIKAGDEWRVEIQKALAAAKVAVLLVSSDFLASKFIMDEELPVLLTAAQAGGVRIVSVILRPCLFEDTPLARFQAINSPSKPLSGMSKTEREATWVKLAQFIKSM